jgi:hypothetical protein
VLGDCLTVAGLGRSLVRLIGAPFAHASAETEDMNVKAKGELLIDRLRQAISDCGMTKRELADATGVAHMVIVYLMIGRDIELKEASRIADYLGLDLRPRPHTLVPVEAATLGDR